MGCGDIIPNVSVTPLGEGLCQIESHHLRGAVIDNAGIIQSVPSNLNQNLVGLQARECARNPAVDYYQVDLRGKDGQWLSLSGNNVRVLSGEIAGVTPVVGTRQGQRGTSDPVTLNAHADGASLCISTSQQGPLRQSLERLVGMVYGESNYCRSLFASNPRQMCGILVPSLQEIYNSHPERSRDGLTAPQSFLEEYGAMLGSGIISLIGAWLGLEGVAYMFGHRVHQWSARYAALQQARNAVGTGGRPGGANAVSGTPSTTQAASSARSTSSRSLLGRLFNGAANAISRIGSSLFTPVIMIDPCSPSMQTDSDFPPLCPNQSQGPVI